MCTTIEQQPCKRILMPTIGRDGMAAAASSAPHRTSPRVLHMQKRALTGGKARTNSGRQSICSGAPALRLWRCCSALAWSHMPGRRTLQSAARSGGPCPCTCTNRLRSARRPACRPVSPRDGRLQHAPARAWWHARTQQQHQARGADVPVHAKRARIACAA
jgi:hypothetical protein